MVRGGGVGVGWDGVVWGYGGMGRMVGWVAGVGGGGEVGGFTVLKSLKSFPF